MLMNKTYRYFDGTTDITGSFTGSAKEERPGEWELVLSQGGEHFKSSHEVHSIQ